MKALPIYKMLSAAGSSKPSDPFWSNTLALFHCENSLSGVSGTGGTPTIGKGANAVFTTSNPKLGTYCIEKTGTASDAGLWLNVADALFSGDFTVEFFARNVNGTGQIFASSDVYGGGRVLDIRQYGWFYVYSNYYGIPGSYFFPSGNTAWHHVAIVRKSGVTKIYFDGAQYGPSWSNSATVDLRTMYLGCTSTGNANQERIAFDEIRVSNIARYSANFTPTTTAFLEGP